MIDLVKKGASIGTVVKQFNDSSGKNQKGQDLMNAIAAVNRKRTALGLSSKEPISKLDREFAELVNQLKLESGNVVEVLTEKKIIEN